MITLHGEGVSRGLAFGRLRFLKRDVKPFPKLEISDPEAEIQRFDRSRNEAIEQLEQLYNETRNILGEEQAFLFKTHQMMLEDLDFCESVNEIIRSENANAEYAVDRTALQFSEMFAGMDDEYMKERASDVMDVSRRVIRILTGKAEEDFAWTEPVIIAADDLAPSETARLDTSKVLAFITSKGSSNSHTAIFARTLGIPAVVGLGEHLLVEYEGKEVFVDGEAGEVCLEADPDTLAELQRRMTAEQERKKYLEQFRGRKVYSPEGRRVLICANIGSPNDLTAVQTNDADGIGLFRSEFLYLGRSSYPTEQEQYEAYRKVAEVMGDRTVVIRTLDIGADKQVDYFQLPKEENPAMGMRGIRICLTRPDVFKTQLRALYRASAHGNIAIMFPMITSVNEVRNIREICAQVRSELKAEGKPFGDKIQLGIMIETPAAAVISDQLAAEVDFFSIGTNDLTQYTLAMDRQNSALEPFLEPHHEAVLRLIRMTVENARKAGIWVGICGELAADVSLVKSFIDMGVDELSMVPGSILEVKARLLGRSDS
jgi:phosphotransferase system enzyme I (PtsI)